MIPKISNYIFLGFFASIQVVSMIFLYDMYSFQYYAGRFNSEVSDFKKIDIKYKSEFLAVIVLMVGVLYLRRLNRYLFKQALESKLVQVISQKAYQYAFLIEKVLDLQFNFIQHSVSFLIALYFYGNNSYLPTLISRGETSSQLLTGNWPFNDTQKLHYSRYFIWAQLAFLYYKVLIYNQWNLHNKYYLELALTNYVVFGTSIYFYYTNQEMLAISLLMQNDQSEAILNFGKWFKELNKGNTLFKRVLMNSIFFAMFASFSYARVVTPFFLYLPLAKTIILDNKNYLTSWEYGFSIKWSTNIMALGLYVFWLCNIIWQIVMVQVAASNFAGKKHKIIEKVWKVE